MTAKSRIFTTAAVLLAGGLALTGCTTASQGSGTGPTSTAGTFDVSTVTKDNALAAQVPAAIRAKGTLTVGADTSYAPAEFLGGADGQTPMGYDVQLAQAIGNMLGLKTTVQTAEFPTILPSLGAKYDLGVSSFFITAERRKAANFVSYVAAGTQWAVQKGNPKKFSLEGICGKTVAVQTGTFQESPDISTRNKACTDTGKPAIKVVSLKNQTDVTTRVINGSADAMAAGSITVGYAITQSKDAIQTLGPQYGASPVGIAVALDDMPLAKVTAAAMNKLIANGDYKKILDQWGVGSVAIPKAEVNPATSK
ncbi:ABC transporter substrate-binding protein [Arthrobacter sp. SDTb3-6]|nr:ABC transporter substrate-binding protein [Arthrobacter sp. SDTb3-6]